MELRSTMKLLELFCGTKSISNVFAEMGVKTFTIDFNPKFNPDLCIDIMDLDISMLPWMPNVVWASPDCRTWSIASVGHHWNNHIPKTDECKKGVELLNKTLDIIEEINPLYLFLENPMGMMRKYPRIQKLSEIYFHHTVTYCKYGDLRMKPTDIWTNNPNWHPKPMCTPKRKGTVNNCHHEKAPRGSKSGTQGLKSAMERSRIPRALCVEIRDSCIL